MEPEMVAFLRRVGKSVTIAFCWLAITATAAIKGDNAFIEGPFRLGNFLFYVWVLLSVLILIWLFKKIWFPKA